MKKIAKLLMLPLIILSLYSCTNTEDDLTNDPTIGWIEFPAASTTVSVDNETTTISIPVEFTALLNERDVDILVNFTLDNILGDAADAVVTNGVVRIPANSLAGVLELNVIPTAATTLVASDISFDVVLQSASSGVEVGLSDGSVLERHTVNLVCDLTLDLGGMYSVTTNYGYHDFLPSFNPNTEVLEITDNGDGTFFVQDFSGGLYNGGPYSAAYGTTATSFDVTFSNSCNKIQWAEQSDPWGAVIPLNGGVNEVDVTTGVVTISWYCEGYGENGVTVYTPM
jgi:hypothetical protein